MLTHPRSALRVLCKLMRLRSGHVTLLRAAFLPPKLSPQRTEGSRRPHVGLCPKFLVAVWFVNYAVWSLSDVDFRQRSHYLLPSRELREIFYTSAFCNVQVICVLTTRHKCQSEAQLCQIIRYNEINDLFVQTSRIFRITYYVFK